MSLNENFSQQPPHFEFRCSLLPTLDLFLPNSGDRPFYGAMVERRDGPSWLRDDDDDITGSF